ncbi:MAG: hypothetical protein GVY19_11170 [Bacteroidetes bacterium]|jgi:ABC-2 type transport system ATP-binding protein|nr:hypothetical protein [Bacteroidota bacterium]
MNIIQTENLTKQYGNTVAADQVSIHIRQGEIYGFPGLKGGGKKTIIRMLPGLIIKG